MPEHDLLDRIAKNRAGLSKRSCIQVPIGLGYTPPSTPNYHCRVTSTNGGETPPTYAVEPWEWVDDRKAKGGAEAEHLSSAVEKSESIRTGSAKGDGCDQASKKELLKASIAML